MKRTFYDHISEICEVARDGATVTYIAFEVRLGGRQYRKLVDHATSAGLIEKTDNMYRTTEKGKEYLTAYKSLRKLIRGN